MKWRARSMRCAFGMPAISSGKATFSITVRQGKVDSSWNTMPIDGCGPVIGLARDRDAAFIVAEQAADDVEQRGLAAAGRADDREEFARRDGERDVVDRGDDAFGRLEVLDDDRRRRAPALRPVRLRRGGVEAASRSPSACLSAFDTAAVIAGV